ELCGVPDLSDVMNGNPRANEVRIHARPRGSDGRDKPVSRFAYQLNVPQKAGGSCEFEQESTRFLRRAWHRPASPTVPPLTGGREGKRSDRRVRLLQWRLGGSRGQRPDE